MKKIIFEGCGTAIATPFTEDGVNFEELKKLLEFQIREGANAIIVCGTTGESSTMSDTERKQTIEFTVKTVDNRIPVIAGTGSNNTKSAIALSKFAASVGVDGILVVTPYYNKTTQKGLIEHYKSIANSVSTPMILYSVPSRTGVNITPETCLELSKIENIVGIKEASGNLSQVAKIANLCGNALPIYSGNDDQVLPILSLGGIGVISVLSNVAPKSFSTMVSEFQKGNIKEARKIQLNSIPLIEALFSEVNPIPVKAALNMLGYNFGIPRLPLVELSDQHKQQLKKELQNYGLL